MAPRVGLFGFGKAGRAVASVLLGSDETRLEWVVRRSRGTENRSAPEFLGIESDEPGTIVSVDSPEYGALFDRKPVVTAVSSYPPETQNKLKQLAENVPVLWSPNITLGVNFLLVASRLLRRIAPWTDVEVVEEHFRDKREVSGTAKKLAQAVDIPPDKIKSLRAGGIIGRHEVLFGFPYQTVRLIHESIGREAFGNGALFAVQHLIGKPPGLYSLETILEEWLA